MTDTIETQARRLIDGDQVFGLAGLQTLERAPSGALRRAVGLELEREGGPRPTVVAMLRGELRRRGFIGPMLPRQHGRADPLVCALVAFGMAALVWAAPASSAEWGGAPALRFSLFPDAAQCSSSAPLARPALVQPIVGDQATRLALVLEHESCFGDRDEGDNRIGIVLEVQL